MTTNQYITSIISRSKCEQCIPEHIKKEALSISIYRDSQNQSIIVRCLLWLGAWFYTVARASTFFLHFCQGDVVLSLRLGFSKKNADLLNAIIFVFHLENYINLSLFSKILFCYKSANMMILNVNLNIYEIYD